MVQGNSKHPEVENETIFQNYADSGQICFFLPNMTFFDMQNHNYVIISL
jgi:hypothetical protein